MTVHGSYFRVHINDVFSGVLTLSWANAVPAEKEVTFRNVALGLQRFSWREPVCVFSGECAGQAETG